MLERGGGVGLYLITAKSSLGGRENLKCCRQYQSEHDIHIYIMSKQDYNDVGIWALLTLAAAAATNVGRSFIFLFFLLSVTYSLLTDFSVVVLIRWLLLKCFFGVLPLFSRCPAGLCHSALHLALFLSVGGWEHTRRFLFCSKRFWRKKLGFTLSLLKRSKKRKNRRGNLWW